MMKDEGSEPAGHDGPRMDTHAATEPAPFDPDEVVEALRGWAKENPHTALAGAALAGFLLGGGLTPRMLAAIGMMAARHYVKQTAGEVLETVLPEEIAAAMGNRRR